MCCLRCLLCCLPLIVGLVDWTVEWPLNPKSAKLHAILYRWMIRRIKFSRWSCWSSKMTFCKHVPHQLFSFPKTRTPGLVQEVSFVKYDWQLFEFGVLRKHLMISRMVSCEHILHMLVSPCFWPASKKTSNMLVLVAFLRSSLIPEWTSIGLSHEPWSRTMQDLLSNWPAR